MICLVLHVFTSGSGNNDLAIKYLYYLELLIILIVSSELFLRIWSAGCRSRYQGWRGRLRFCGHFFCILDIIIVVSSFSILLFSSGDGTTTTTMAAPTAFRLLRFLVVVRMVRVDRRGSTWKLLSSVVFAHSKELITTWYIGWLMLLLCACLVFQFEVGTSETIVSTCTNTTMTVESDFKSLGDSIWWAFITLATIGYGDMTPKTIGGKITASLFGNFGIAFFALPAGILGTGFALKVQEQNRVKHFVRRRIPAAILIQTAWRCYTADKNNDGNFKSTGCR